MSKVPTEKQGSPGFVISDLHVGGRLPHMMSRPDRLASSTPLASARRVPSNT